MLPPFNANLSSGQAVLNAIPLRARSVLPKDIVIIPLKPTVTVATVGDKVVAWTCKLTVSTTISVRIAYFNNHVELAYDGTKSLDLLRAVQGSGIMRSFNWNDNIGRWVYADY